MKDIFDLVVYIKIRISVVPISLLMLRGPAATIFWNFSVKNISEVRFSLTFLYFYTFTTKLFIVFYYNSAKLLWWWCWQVIMILLVTIMMKLLVVIMMMILSVVIMKLMTINSLVTNASKYKKIKERPRLWDIFYWEISENFGSGTPVALVKIEITKLIWIIK